MPRITATIEEEQLNAIDDIAHNRSAFIRNAVSEKIERMRRETIEVRELNDKVASLEDRLNEKDDEIENLRERVQDLENQGLYDLIK